MGEVNGAAGFEVEMSPQTEYQRHILHLSLMVDEGSLSALNTNRRRCTLAVSTAHPMFIESSLLKVSAKGKLISVTHPCSGVMSRPCTAVHTTSPHAPRAAAAAASVRLFARDESDPGSGGSSYVFLVNSQPLCGCTQPHADLHLF